MKKFTALLMVLVFLVGTGIIVMADTHNWDSGEWLLLPTCDHKGQKLLRCTNSGCNETKIIEVSSVAHDYLPATCTKAEKCKWCGTTKPGSKKLGHILPEPACIDQYCLRTDCTFVVEREPKAHRYQPATCEKASSCTLCGVTQGAALGHDFAAATCTAPATCKNCGKTEGAKRSHIYFPATCTKLAACRYCGATTGTLKEHNFQDGKCTVCNKPQYTLEDAKEDDLEVI